MKLMFPKEKIYIEWKSIATNIPSLEQVKAEYMMTEMFIFE